MSATTSDTSIVSTREPRKDWRSLDEYITEVSLDRTLGDVVRMRSSAPSARTAFVASTICNAIFDLDIGLIAELVKRIDGIAPNKGEMDEYSNLFSDALEDVLSYTQSDQMTIYPSDPPIIALAKATVAVSLSDPGRNMQARKDRQKAVQMILDRVEGRRSEPAKPIEAKEYAAPEWMGLPGGDDDGDDD